MQSDTVGNNPMSKLRFSGKLVWELGEIFPGIYRYNASKRHVWLFKVSTENLLIWTSSSGPGQVLFSIVQLFSELAIT